MLGRPVLYTIAAAAIAVLSASGASAGCYSCGCSAPVYSYAYVSPCATYALPPMYVVNQGPSYTLPVYPYAAEPTPSYPYVGRRYSTYTYDDADDVTYRPSYRYRDYGYRHRHHHYGRDLYRGDRYRHRDSYRHRLYTNRMHTWRAPVRNRGLAPGFVHPK